MRIGVAGVGALGRHHARVARDLAGACCSGVFDVDADRAAGIGARLEVPVRRSLEELLEASDGVVVAAPTAAHEEVALAAIAAGVHVLVEKPIAPDLASADRILAAAEAAGVVVQTGHVERFNPVILAARPFLERPLFVEAHRLAPFVPRSLDVAVVLDLMIHDLDLLCHLVRDQVREIAAVGMPVLSSLPDIANARIAFQGGAVANVTASRISVRKVRKVRVWQASGYLSLDLAAGTGDFFRVREGVSVLDGPVDLAAASARGLDALVERVPLVGDASVEPLAAEQASFADAIRGAAPAPVSGRDGRRALELALAIQQEVEAHVAHTRAASA